MQTARDTLADLAEATGASGGEDLLLVLDDAHELHRDPAAAEFVEYLCHHGPDRLRIALATRNEPPFSLARLRGRGEVGEIDAARLAFDADDVARFAAAVLGDVDPDLVRAVHEATDGWPAAVRLTVESLAGAPPHRRRARLDAVNGPGGRLAAYLTEEVLGTQSDEAGLLLRHLACLGAADAEALRATGIPDAPLLLPDLARRGLAVNAGVPEHAEAPGPADEPHDAWRAAEPLRRCAQASPPLGRGTVVTIHRKAAASCAERGRYDWALTYFRAVGDHAATAALLAEHGMELINAGRLDAVIDAADLPYGYLDDEIRQLVGYAKQLRGLWASADAQFAAVGTDPTAPALVWRKGLLAQVRGEFGEALAIYRGARLEREDTAEESLLLAWTATAHRMIGQLDAAREYGARALAAAKKSGDASALSAAYTAQATIAEARGDYVEAEACTFSALHAAEEGNDVLATVRAQLSQSSYMTSGGKPGQALELAQRVEEAAGKLGYRLTVAMALVSQGLALQVLGRLDDAAARFAEARDLCRQIGTRYLAWPLCGLGGVHMLRGESAAARAAFEEAVSLTAPTKDAIGHSWALAGLARVRAAEDPREARALVNRAAALNEGVTEIEVLLAGGWTELAAGDRRAAHDAAERAEIAARARRNLPGLIEALLLTASAASDPPARTASLDAAARLAREIGAPIEEASARLAAARLAGRAGAGAARAAEETLRSLGVEPSAAAGPLAQLPASGRRRVAVRTFGGFEVRVDGRPVPPEAWQSRKARDLLKILVARRGRQVPRDELIELLWPDADPVKASARLSVQLSTLRAVLQPEPGQSQPEVLTADRDTVRVDLDLVEVDAEEFLAVPRDALEADAAKRPDALERLLTAESVCAGPFLEGDRYADWAQSARDEIETSYRSVVRKLIPRLRALGDVDGAIRRCLTLLNHDAYDEQVHLALIGVLLDAGRYGEARRRYRGYAERMKEIAVEPSPWPGAARRPRQPPAGAPRAL